MAKRRLLLVGVLGVLALAFAAGVVFLGDRFFTATRPVDSALLARGQALYANSCAVCHGANLEGQANWQQRGPDGLLPAPPHDETGHTWHHPDQQLFQIIKLGTAAIVGGDYKTSMIGFGDQLSDDDIRAILEYIKSTWPEPIRQRQAEVTARAAQGQ